MSADEVIDEPVTEQPAQPAPEPEPEPERWHTASGYTWNDLQQMSVQLSQSTLVPAQYRRQPANIVMMAMTGQELGWGVMSAMRFIHIIEGKPSVSPEGMLALIRRAGHSVSGSSTSRSATVRGVRHDNGDTMEVTFTWEDALRAKLTAKDNWQKYPEAMLWARALAMLARRLFPDVMLGAAYVPDEMGAVTDASGAPLYIDTTARDVSSSAETPDWVALGWTDEAQCEAAQRDTKRLLDQLPPDVQAALRTSMGKRPELPVYTVGIWARRHQAVLAAAREHGIADDFAETAPTLMRDVLGDDPPTDSATGDSDGADPEPEQEGTSPTVAGEEGETDVDPPATAGELTDRISAGVIVAVTGMAPLGPPPVREPRRRKAAPPAPTVAPTATPAYTPDDDAADAAWVAEALGHDDQTALDLDVTPGTDGGDDDRDDIGY